MDETRPSAAIACPSWCVTRHGHVDGEDDWVHTGMVTMVRDDLVARLCMTVDPSTGTPEGPYVLLNDIEVSLADAAALGEALIDMAQASPETGARIPSQARER